MKILLTGASGFVGSHILDSLRAKKYPVSILVRSTSSQGFLREHLGQIEICQGSILDRESLAAAMRGATHVVHCAGATRASTNEEYFRINQQGTRNVVDAANENLGTLRRLIHISSLAVTGPATPDAPANESSPARPISQYGASKLAAETEVRSQCRAEFVILRPPAVYGPRDNGFLSLFQAVERHVLPKPSASQSLSLVYVKDLAEAVAVCVDHPGIGGRTFFVASPEIVTARLMAEEIGRQSGRWTFPCPLPPVAFFPVCALNQAFSKLTGRATLLNMQKFAELRAPGWVCDPSRLRTEVGYACGTRLREGIGQTLNWYREQRWV
jgi:nucleoside-diphosphate-sugar epimerase